MATLIDVRTKLVNLLENRKKLDHELQLKNETFEKCKAERIKMEADRVEKYAEMLAKERKLEEIHSKLVENQEKIEELEKSAQECKKTSDVLATKIDQKDELILQLQTKADEAQSLTVSSGKTYSETLDRFRDIQVASERMERRESQLHGVLRELEQDKAVLENKLKKLETLGVQASERQDKLTKAIQACNDRLQQANQRAADAEEAYEGLSCELADLEEEAAEWTSKVKAIQEQVETVKVSIQAT